MPPPPPRPLTWPQLDGMVLLAIAAGKVLCCLFTALATYGFALRRRALPGRALQLGAMYGMVRAVDGMGTCGGCSCRARVQAATHSMDVNIGAPVAALLFPEHVAYVCARCGPGPLAAVAHAPCPQVLAPGDSAGAARVRGCWGGCALPPAPSPGGAGLF